MKSVIALTNMQKKLKGKAHEAHEIDASMEEMGQAQDMDLYSRAKKQPGSPLGMSESGAEISDDHAAQIFD